VQETSRQFVKEQLSPVLTAAAISENHGGLTKIMLSSKYKSDLIRDACVSRKSKVLYQG